MVKMTVDGAEIEVAAGSTVMQACEQAGAEIPRFCYHERLSIAGNCRMCLVEVEKAPKPIASCAYPIAEGMVVRTDTPMVRQARRGVMEFLLINHPLDCPICDQGGECDLQDQSFAYGMDHSRYAENKRAVTDKYLGPLVKTVMTRCIQCTRCIRFATEIAGVPELGATSRGEDMEIGTYVEKALTSELSGNLIDICPVGALTSKPYAFVARPWELQKTDSVDVMDALGTPIRIDTRGPEVLRILPRVDDALNEEWLSDKARFAFDGLKRRRLDKPWVRRQGRLEPATWPDALAAIASRLRGVAGTRVGAIAGDLCDAESMLALRDFMAQLGSANLDCRQDGAGLVSSRREFYLFNSTIAGIDAADALLLVGCNPRREAPVLNARLRRRVANSGVRAGMIGAVADLTYSYTHLGDRPDVLQALLEDDQAFGRVLRDAKRPMIILGQGALARGDGSAVLKAAWSLADAVGALTPDWHGFNVLHGAASRVAGLDMGFVPGENGRGLDGMMGGGVDVLWLLGADEFDTSRIGADTFVIYQGHHGDRSAARADVILPGCAYTEKDGTYVNTEGRVQHGYRALVAPGEAREDWRILRGMSDVMGKALPYDDLDGVRAHLAQANPVFARTGAPRFGASDRTPPHADGELSTMPFLPAVTDYFQTNSISRASLTMAEWFARSRGPTRDRGGIIVHDFFYGSLAGDTVRIVAETLALLVPVLIGMAYATYFERKALGAFQLRRGPNRVGPFGLFQPFADAVKVFTKETVIPAGANRLLFLFAPMLTFMLACMAWAVIPVANGWAVSDMNVGILYLFAISSMGVYGVIIAGWASNSKYAFLGAMRSAAQMVSYEVSIGFVLVSVLLCVGSLNLNAIVLAQNHIWFCVPLFPMFVVFLVSMLAETNRAPFDLPEGESEIVAGFFVEYSAMAFALFYLGEYTNMIMMSALASILFLGGWQALPFLGFIPGVFWLIAKICCIMFFFFWVRATFPRFRYDQLMRLGWKVFLPLSLGWLVLTAGFLEAFHMLPESVG